MTSIPRKQAEAASIGRRILSIPTLLSFVIAGSFIFFLVTRFDLDWHATWDNLRGMNPWLYLLAFLLYYLSFGFRGVRWRLLAKNAGLESQPGARVPSVLQSTSLIIIGWFVNSITWLRLGDAYRAYAFSEESRSGFSWSLGTVLAERILDMATVLVLIVLSMLLLTMSTDIVTSGSLVTAATIMAIGLLGLAYLMKACGARLARFLPGRFEKAYHRFQDGTLGSFKHLPTIFALGLVGWLMEIARLYFVVEALGLDVSLPLVCVVALGHALLSVVPTPGGLGAVEPGMIGLLTLSLEPHNAVSITLVDRSITYLGIILVGGLAFLMRQLARDKRLRKKEPPVRGVEEHPNIADA